MKRFFTLIFSVAAVLSSMATTFTFTSSDHVSQTKDGITVTLSKASGNNDPFFSVSEEMRLYANNTITISGGNLTDISLTFAKQGSKDYATMTASTGTLASGGVSTSKTDQKTDKWTGSATSVTFTLGNTGQRILTGIVVNGTGSSEPSQPSEPSEPDQPGPGDNTLDPDYTYSEPTTVRTPSTTVQGDSYWFIDNNIMVSCTKGATNDSYFSAHAGFDMTFTATQPIKGIVINGFVKKDFEATVNQGKVSYLTPDVDTEGNPVVVITDVDSKSVTISCVKQLRCYSVDIYFQSNPQEEVSGGGSSSTEDLTFDTAEAVYESEFVDWIGEENYSIFLFNGDAPYYPYVALDIYPEKKDEITGTYRMSDYSLGDYTYYVYGETENDIAWAEDGQVTISKSGDNYTITGYMVGDNKVRYNFTFTGHLPFYLDSDYYVDDDEDDAGVQSVTQDTDAEFNPDAPMYNIHGQRVDKTYRGFIIQDGYKFLLR